MQSILHDCFTLQIQSRSCFIQEQNWRISNQSPGDGDSLLLPSRQLRSPFADEGVELGRKLVDEVEGVGGLGGGFDFRKRGVGIAEADVGFDRSREENRFLTHEPDVRAEVFEFVIPDVLSIERDSSFVDVVEPLQQLQHRRLAAARRSNEGDALPRSSVE